MHLITHGGKCCAVRTIHTLGSGPDIFVSALRESPLFKTNKLSIQVKGGGWEFGRPGERFYLPAAPREKTRDRLARYIAYTEKLRPKGMIEVLVVQDPGENTLYDQYHKWKPVLEEFDFKDVNSFENWNTGRIVHVFNRNSGAVGVTPVEFNLPEM